MKTLLVLEDEPSVLSLMRHMLKRYQLIEAATAEQALELFTHGLHRIDLLIADVTLPKSSGIQVALLLRSAIPDLPVILTSGRPADAWNDRDTFDLERLGPQLVTTVVKPFEAQILREAVYDLLGTPLTEKATTA